MVTRFRADVSVAKMVGDIKSISSGWCNERPGPLGRFAWQTGYGAFTVSESQLERVREYVRNQKAHHREVSFKEEFLSLLRRHNIEFDDRYIFD